jgi:hypothetical protein
MHSSNRLCLFACLLTFAHLSSLALLSLSTLFFVAIISQIAKSSRELAVDTQSNGDRCSNHLITIAKKTTRVVSLPTSARTRTALLHKRRDRKSSFRLTSIRNPIMNSRSNRSRLKQAPLPLSAITQPALLTLCHFRQTAQTHTLR